MYFKSQILLHIITEQDEPCFKLSTGTSSKKKLTNFDTENKASPWQHDILSHQPVFTFLDWSSDQLLRPDPCPKLKMIQEKGLQYFIIYMYVMNSILGKQDF